MWEKNLLDKFFQSFHCISIQHEERDLDLVDGPIRIILGEVSK